MLGEELAQRSKAFVESQSLIGIIWTRAYNSCWILTAFPIGLGFRFQFYQLISIAGV
jgi:hypothetical protein